MWQKTKVGKRFGFPGRKDSQSTVAYCSPLRGALACVQNAMRFVEPAVSLLLPDLPNKKGHLKVTFIIWRARQESNLQPPA